MSDKEKDTAQVIQFPMKGKPHKDVVIDNTTMELRENIIWADHLTEGLIVNMIHNLESNGILIHDEEFIKHVSFLIETLKSVIYNDMDMEHPLQRLINLLVTGTKVDGRYETNLDYGLLDEILDDIYDEKE